MRKKTVEIETMEVAAIRAGFAAMVQQASDMQFGITHGTYDPDTVATQLREMAMAGRYWFRRCKTHLDGI